MAWVTILILVVMFAVLSKTTIPASVVFLSALTLMLVFGVVDTTTALSGFSSSSVITVAALFVVIAGLHWSGVMKWIVGHTIGKPKSYASALLRIIFPSAIMSSVVADNSVCAMLIKIVQHIAKKLDVAASKLLIPMSYAVIVGGTLTLIGTAPNLIVAGLYADKTHDPMNIFTITPAAIICLIVFIVAMFALKGLLPTRKSPDESFEQADEYTAELLVPTLSDKVGKTVEDSGLENVQGGHLIEIVRFDKEVISPVPSDEFIMGGDRLVFSGNIQQIEELKEKQGLVATDKHVFTVNDLEDRKLMTATLKFNSSLKGRRMCDTDFEKKHNVVLVAVSHNGERINESPRNITLRAGDTMLLECPIKASDKEFYEEVKDDLVFHETEKLVDTSNKTFLSVAILIAMLLLSAFNVLTLMQSAMLAAVAMLVCQCCSPKKAQQSIDWSVVMSFACSVVFAKAIQDNGIAGAVANGLAGISGGNIIAGMIVMAIITFILTEIANSTAVAAILFPIAYQLAVILGADTEGFCLMLALCASMSFILPIGSSTNALVYGPGGYRISDFLKIGLPMTIIMLATIVTATYFIYIK